MASVFERQRSLWLQFKSQVPHRPGIYIYKDQKGEVLYVGKAIDLYSRVSSYFQASSLKDDSKVKALVENIVNLETIVVESELEALLLEANLIKKYLPPFNIRLIDDKDYLYIGITNETFPKVITARRKDLESMQKYWGPFPSAKTVRNTLKPLRRLFPWCTVVQNSGFHPKGGKLNRPCFLDTAGVAKTRQRPCFYYHLGLCPGACAGLISPQDYNKILSRFAKMMDGKKTELMSDLTKEMSKAASLQKFEEASRIKKLIEGIVYMTQPNRTALYLENPNFLEQENKLALAELQKALNLPKVPQRIEGYDISNIQGHEATGSMVVLTNGEIDKSQYRKFKIHITGRPNDVGMHKEMMSRRLNHPEWPLPDLIIIDGGRGQVRGVYDELRTTNNELPIFGLAKKMEWLYPPEGEIVKLSKRSPALKLLQKLRDEAHRFAISYHRKLHKRAFFNQNLT